MAISHRIFSISNRIFAISYLLCCRREPVKVHFLAENVDNLFFEGAG